MASPRSGDVVMPCIVMPHRFPVIGSRQLQLPGESKYVVRLLEFRRHVGPIAPLDHPEHEQQDEPKGEPHREFVPLRPSEQQQHGLAGDPAEPRVERGPRGGADRAAGDEGDHAHLRGAASERQQRARPEHEARGERGTPRTARGHAHEPQHRRLRRGKSREQPRGPVASDRIGQERREPAAEGAHESQPPHVQVLLVRGEAREHGRGLLEEEHRCADRQIPPRRIECVEQRVALDRQQDRQEIHR